MNALFSDASLARRRHDLPSRIIPRVLLLALLIALCLVRQRAETLEQALTSRNLPVAAATGH